MIHKFTSEAIRVLLTTVDAEPAIADPSEIYLSVELLEQGYGQVNDPG